MMGLLFYLCLYVCMCVERAYIITVVQSMRYVFAWLLIPWDNGHTDSRIVIRV